MKTRFATRFIIGEEAKNKDCFQDLDGEDFEEIKDCIITKFFETKEEQKGYENALCELNELTGDYVWILNSTQIEEINFIKEYEAKITFEDANGGYINIVLDAFDFEFCLPSSFERTGEEVINDNDISIQISYKRDGYMPEKALKNFCKKWEVNIEIEREN